MVNCCVMNVQPTESWTVTASYTYDRWPVCRWLLDYHLWMGMMNSLAFNRNFSISCHARAIDSTHCSAMQMTSLGKNSTKCISFFGLFSADHSRRQKLTRALKMVDPLHHSSLLYAVYMTVIVDEPSGLQYQTVVWELDAGGPGVLPDDTRRLKPTVRRSDVTTSYSYNTRTHQKMR